MLVAKNEKCTFCLSLFRPLILCFKFAIYASDEYNKQMIEYRATGGFPPNDEFVKLSDANVWVRKEANLNDLEKEICGYETVVFPKRPPAMNDASQGLGKSRWYLKEW
jgi:hypothetical protein